jgi:hypothetical protein
VRLFPPKRQYASCTRMTPVVCSCCFVLFFWKRVNRQRLFVFYSFFFFLLFFFFIFLFLITSTFSFVVHFQTFISSWYVIISCICRKRLANNTLFFLVILHTALRFFLGSFFVCVCFALFLPCFLVFSPKPKKKKKKKKKQDKNTLDFAVTFGLIYVDNYHY